MVEPWAALGMSRDQFVRQSEQVDRLIASALRHTTTFLWFTKGRQGPPRGMTGASIFLVDLGKGPLGITASHVYRPYEEAKRQNRNLVCHVGARVLYLDERLIDCDEALDLATFKITPDEVSAGEIIKTCHAGSRGWPPPAPTVGEAVVVGGFCKKDRDQESDEDLVTGFGALVFEATSVNERQIVCQWDCEKDQLDGLGYGDRLTPEVDLGGLSGGAVWRQDPGDPNGLELIGVVSECHPGLGLLHATRTDFIDADGIIRRPLI